ncbi:hypothetical protein EX30DRAFT_343800 [Ascodesmis nigricans]|uniref:MARVEL domain-containing protein n=1 Tax=Ascodesmis nigricans TaxID=341454 RepID=A0A4S2MRN6_9PEZI|nr:hypothetical protein EX30DRAFT_343800 [Ascodesmis nigricans]
MINLILPLRAVQGVLNIIILGLAAYCVDITGKGPYGWTYSEAAFLVFTTIWTLLVLAYLVLTPMFMPKYHNRWAVLGLEAVTMIFWFAGFIAMAASIGGIHCNSRYYGEEACRGINTAKAAAALGAFEWLAWAVTLGLIIQAIIASRRGDRAADPDAEQAAAA